MHRTQQRIYRTGKVRIQKSCENKLFRHGSFLSFTPQGCESEGVSKSALSGG
jgi:hypothetical protein